MPRSPAIDRQRELEAMPKAELHRLADGLVLEEPLAVERCIEFVVAETKGLWHGRARAMMCRRLKHCSLTEEQVSLLVSCIVCRLQSGAFSEQFKDQLRLAMHLNAPLLFKVSRSCSSNAMLHIRRYADWLLSHEESFTQA